MCGLFRSPDILGSEAARVYLVLCIWSTELCISTIINPVLVSVKLSLSFLYRVDASTEHVGTECRVLRSARGTGDQGRGTLTNQIGRTLWNVLESRPK